jgi:hypothetical protein
LLRCMFNRVMENRVYTNIVVRSLSSNNGVNCLISILRTLFATVLVDAFG